jgi:aryl-alcohol dehydrogenase-like predicted oxidoreductase
MRYKLFGGTGLRVSELFLSAMTFGEQGGWAPRLRSPGASWTRMRTRAATSSTPRSTTAAIETVGLTVAAWSPLADGILSGKYTWVFAAAALPWQLKLP